MRHVPPHLLANWADWRLGDVDALAADVLARCEEARRAWAREPLELLRGGEVALVLAARAPSGEDRVLKLSPRSAAAAESLEGPALALWACHDAAPRVIGSRDAGATLLLERVRPGGSLGSPGRAPTRSSRRSARSAGDCISRPTAWATPGSRRSPTTPARTAGCARSPAPGSTTS